MSDEPRPYVPGPLEQLWEEDIARMRETPGVGRCPACGEYADPDRSGLAKQGQLVAEDKHGHRWLVVCS